MTETGEVIPKVTRRCKGMVTALKLLDRLFPWRVQRRVYEQYLRSLYDDLACVLHLLEQGKYDEAEVELRASYATRLTLDLYADAKANDFRLMRAGPGADGRFEISVRTELAQHFVGMMAGWFKDQGATNYVEMSVYSEELGPLVFTMQRLHGKTPHQLRQEAEAELAATRAGEVGHV